MGRRFNTLYDRENKGNYTSACGCGVRPVYDYIPVGKEGKLKLVQVGEENRQGIIESWEESVDLHALLSRYFDGDASALERRQAMFADITGFPDNVHAYHDAANMAQSVFDNLPDDVRHFYGDSLQDFLQGFFSGRFPPAAAEDNSVDSDSSVES